MNLTTILTETYQRLGFDAAPGAGAIARLTAFANSEVREILSDPILSKLRRRTVPLVTVALSPYCALPQAAVRVYSIVDRTNQRPLDERDQEWIREQDPGRTESSSTPEAYAVIGFSQPTAAQPSDSSQLLVKSSAAGDTTQTAYIEVINSDGYLQSLSVALNGTVAANLGPADSLIVTDFYLSAVAVGEVTLTEDTGAGTELAKIGIGRTRTRYTSLEIYPTPATAVTLYADVDVEIVNMVNGTDEPIIPDEFCEVIIHGVRKREYQKQEKRALADMANADRFPFLARMRHRMHQKSAATQDAGRRSQLGPYYPAGS